MHSKRLEDWQNALWRILTNPAFEVVAAIVLVLIAAWIVVMGGDFENGLSLPVRAK